MSVKSGARIKRTALQAALSPHAAIKALYVRLPDAARRKLNHRVGIYGDQHGAVYKEPPPPEGVVDSSASASAAPEGGSAPAAAAAEEAEVKEADESMMYDCVGVMLHAGSTQGGHYTALVKPPTTGAGDSGSG